VLTAATTAAATTVAGTFSSQPASSYLIQFYKVAKVTTTALLKGHKNVGVSTINIVFNEAMAPLADSTKFYEVLTPQKVRVHKKTTTEMVPVSFTERVTAANTVTLKLAKPSKQPLTLTVKSGDPATAGQTLGANYTATFP
jgi:hypothetical protein